MGRWKTFHWVAIAALGLIGLLQVPTRAQEAQTPKTTPAATPAPDPQDSAPAQYIGSEVCKTCHEDIYDNWEKTPHWKTMLDTKGGPSHQGCESATARDRRTWRAAETSRRFSFSRNTRPRKSTIAA